MHNIHTLKVWPEPFKAMVNGTKTHEIRKADRPFEVGDTLYLREWDSKSEEGDEYTGSEIFAEITYITKGGEWGLPSDLCVMSIKAISTYIHRS